VHILITGSSGLIGSALRVALRKEQHDITCMSRKKGPEGQVWWDIKNHVIHLPKNHPIDAVIHLAGENIAGGPWTATRKQRIGNSRIQGTTLLCEALASLEHKPNCLISASAVGFYGSQGAQKLDESSPAGQGFLAEVCQSWEKATDVATDAGIRVVQARLGVVLDKQGGMLPRMLLPFRLGLGGPLGHGQQVMSWVSLTDLIRSFDFILNHPDLQGPVNITSPNPVTNEAFTQALAQALHRPAYFRVPGLAIEWLLGDLGRQLLLASQNVLPQKLQDAGFKFNHKEIKPTLEHLLKTAKTER
jgi:uncharacterized protein (TIGR01777 family)